MEKLRKKKKKRKKQILNWKVNYEKTFRDRGSGFVVRWKCLCKDYRSTLQIYRREHY